MPGRQYTGATGYRYGFNGQEKDDEVKGSGNSLNFGDRTFDSRLGRFLSGDPIGFVFSWQSPYAYALNSPITYVDDQGAGPKKRSVSAGNPKLWNAISGGRSFVHNLVALVNGGNIPNKPLGPNDVTMFSGHGNQGQNLDKNFKVVPGQTTIWYNDYEDYDQMEVWTTTPPPTLLWRSGRDDNRQVNPLTGCYKGTTWDENFAKKDCDIRTGLYSVPERGWGSYTIPADAPTTVNIKVFSSISPFDGNNPFEKNRTGNANNSVWYMYIRNGKMPESPKDNRQGHMNVRYLGDTPSNENYLDTHPYNEEGAEFPTDEEVMSDDE